MELIRSKGLTKFGSPGALGGRPGAPKEPNFKTYLLPHFLSNLDGAWLILKVLLILIDLCDGILNFCPGPKIWAVKNCANLEVPRTAINHNFLAFC